MNELTPEEKIALMIADRQVADGEVVTPNISATLVSAMIRLYGPERETT